LWNLLTCFISSSTPHFALYIKIIITDAINNPGCLDFTGLAVSRLGVNLDVAALLECFLKLPSSGAISSRTAVFDENA
jgi:hypothetical protein